LNNLSTPAEQYYACPHCLIKLDVISTQPQKEEKKKDKPPVKPPEKKEKGSRCPHHFGYLASRHKNVPIPQECLICPKVLDCTMK